MSSIVFWRHGVDFGSFKFDIHNAIVCVANPCPRTWHDGRIWNENLPCQRVLQL